MNRKHLLSRKVVLVAALGLVALTPLYASAANKLIVKDATGTIDKFVVTDTGFVGVGTSTPPSAITILGPMQTSAQLKMMSNQAGAGANGGGGILVGHNNGTAFPLNGDRLGYFNFGAADATTPTTNRFGAAIQANAAGDWSFDGTAHFPTVLRFNTAGTSGPQATRLTIDQQGNIGIGTQTPAERLEVNGGIKLNTATAKPTCDSTRGGVLWFTPGGGAKDSLEVCASDGSNYAWRTLY